MIIVTCCDTAVRVGFADHDSVVMMMIMIQVSSSKFQVQPGPALAVRVSDDPSPLPSPPSPDRPSDSDGQNDSELENNFKSYWQVTNLNLKFKSRSAALPVSPRTGDRRGRKPAFQVVQVTHDNELEASLCEVQVSPSRTSQFRVSPSHGQRGSTRRR